MSLVPPQFMLLSGPGSNGGTVVTGGGDFRVVSGSIPFRLDRRNQLNIKVPRDSAWLASASPKQHVIRVDQVEHGIVSEWVLTVTHQEKGSPLVDVYGEPLETILRDVGPMRDSVSGGGSYYSLGGVELTIQEYLDTYVLPFLASLGLTWITAGTIEDASTHTVTWDRWSPLRLLNELESRTRFEFQLRRTGEIDFLERIGSTAPVPVIATGKNLTALAKTTDPSGFATVVQAFGGIPEGSTERATMGLAQWIVSNKSGSTFTLSALNGGPGPWAIDDQGNSLYIRTAAGDITAITDSATSGSTTVADASGISDGDYVMIVADASGSLVEELEDPSGTARVVGTYANDDLRGEANFLANPWVQDWPTKPSGVYARVSGDHVATSTSLTLKDIVPSNQAFAAGDFVSVLFPLGHPVCRVTSSATASGGSVTLSITPAVWAGTSTNNNFFLYNNSPVVVHTGLAGGAPDQWTDVQLGTTSAAVFQHRTTTLTDLTGTISALDDFSVPLPPTNVSSTAAVRVTVSGLGAGAIIQTGDALWFEDTQSQPYRFIIAPTTADGSGVATVTINQNRPAAAVGDTVRIVRPAFPDDLFRTPSSESICFLAHRKNFASDTELAGCVFDLPTVTLPYIPTAPNVWLKGGFTVRGEGGINNAGAVRPCRLQLLSQAGAVLAEVVPPAFGFTDASGSGPMFGNPRDHDAQVELSVGVALTAPLTVTPRVIGCYRADTSNINAGHPFTFVRWLMLQVGSDDQAAPPIIGSHATRLWQAANDRLLLHRQLPEEIKVTSRELVEHFGLTPAEAKLQLGGTVRLMDPEIGTDDEYRVVEVIYDAVDASNTSFVLTTRLREAMAAIERRFKELGEGSTRLTSGSASDPPAVVTQPPSTTQPPPTGGTGITGNGRDIFVSSYASPPSAPAGFTPYWHIPDRGIYRKWQDGEWQEVVESSQADLRVAHVEGASLGALLADYELLRMGHTVDDDGNALTGDDEGTEFPSNPATGRRFWRTDRSIRYVYDGTRWLSTEPHTLFLQSIVNVTVSTNGAPTAYPSPGLYDIWVENAAVAHTLSATGNWTLGINKHTDTTGTSLGTITVTNTGSSYDSSFITVDAVVANTVNLFYLSLTENSGSAAAFAHGVLNYRLIG